MYVGVPYDCDSIMHYGAETFSRGLQKPTMEAKLPKECDLRWGKASDAEDLKKRKKKKQVCLFFLPRKRYGLLLHEKKLGPELVSINKGDY